MNCFPVRVITVLAVFTLHVTPMAFAQTAAPQVGGFVTANFGMAQPAPSVLDSIASVTEGVNRDAVRLTGTMKASPVIDLGGGVMLRNRWLFGVAYDRSAQSAPSEIVATLEHPQFHPTLLARRETDALKRVEEGTHLSAGINLPVGKAFSLKLFGGPSYLTRKQQLLNDIDLREPFNTVTRTYSATIDSFETKTVRSSAWGYHVGADGTYFFSRFVGVGAQLRYTRATFDTENLLQSDLNGRTVTDLAKGGGLRMAAGVRLRF